jgi:hypothetical protein
MLVEHYFVVVVVFEASTGFAYKNTVSIHHKDTSRFGEVEVEKLIDILGGLY